MGWFFSSAQQLPCRNLVPGLTLLCCCSKATCAELPHSGPGQIVTGLAPYDVVNCFAGAECYDETTSSPLKRRLKSRMAQSAKNHRRSVPQQSALPVSDDRLVPKADLPHVKTEPACSVPLDLTQPVTNSLATPEQADLLQVCSHAGFNADHMVCCSSQAVAVFRLCTMLPHITSSNQQLS